MREDSHQQFGVFFWFSFGFELVPNIALLNQDYHNFGVV
jgi:hypothetical protein